MVIFYYIAVSISSPIWLLPNILGAPLFAFGLISSLLISSVSVFILIQNITIRIYFSAILILYGLNVLMFFLCTEKGTWKSFFWGMNWKQSLRDEVWITAAVDGKKWKLEKLTNDIDAGRAVMIVSYNTSALPWDEIISWLKGKTEEYIDVPPLWLTFEWLEHVPSDIQNKIWTITELIRLKESIENADRTKESSRKKIIKVTGKARKNNSSKMLSFNSNVFSRSSNSNKSQSNSIKSTSLIKSSSSLKSLKVEVVSNNISNKSKSFSEEEQVMNSNVINQMQMQWKEKVQNESIKRLSKAKDRDKSHITVLTRRTLSFQNESNVEENKRRRSSVLSLMFVEDDLPKLRDVKMNEIELKEIDIRNILEKYFKSCEMLNSNENIESKVNDLLDYENICNQEPSLIEDTIKLILREMGKYVKQTNGIVTTSAKQRILFAGFLEFLDEVSDITVAIMFYLNPKLQWAATLMFIFMLLNRTLQVCFSIIFRETWLGHLIAFIGLKPIVETYRAVTGDPNQRVGDSSTALNIVRAYRSTLALVCESLPQMMLQLYIFLSTNEIQNTTIFYTQLFSVFSSCIAHGMSVSSLCLDALKRLKGKFPSCTKFLPSDDKPIKQMGIFICMIIWSTLHLFIYAFGISTLFAKAPLYVSFGIIGLHFITFTLSRYFFQEGNN